jgi:arabinogalactan endo-1,4-beta-galactosidase
MRWGSIVLVLLLLVLSIRYEPISLASTPFIRGVDISTLQAVEADKGGFFVQGQQSDLLAILKKQGINYVRLRIWNNPVEAQGFNDLQHTVAMAKRVKKAGLGLLLDFHYSDFWADPGKQNKPAAWANLSQKKLESAVYSYTLKVITTLKKNKAMPDAVQIGNEIAGGILWPNGKTWGDGAGGFDNLAALLNAGIHGVQQASGSKTAIKIMLHVDEGTNTAKSRWFFDAIQKRKVTYDWIGLSYYPYWNGPIQALEANLTETSRRYKKPVLIVETAIGYTLESTGQTTNIFGPNEAAATGYATTPAGQAKFIRDLIKSVKTVPNRRGLGLFYWEPAWIPTDKASNYATSANAWKNQALFDYGGEMLPGLPALGKSN